MIAYNSYKLALESFGLAYVSKETPLLDLDVRRVVQSYALKAGYVIPLDSVTELMEKFIYDVEINPNTTFYKVWDDVLSKTRLELLEDQIRHYLSTYGNSAYLKESGQENMTELLQKVQIDSVEETEEKNTYIPNSDPAQIDFSIYKVVTIANATEIAEICFKLLESGIALSKETIDMCLDFMKEALEQENWTFSIDNIKNKEALCIICDSFGLKPLNPVELLRFLVYKATGSTMLIKDSGSMQAILKSKTDEFSRLTTDELERLSQIFYRFKPIFLWFKHASKANSHNVNIIRRLAKKNHVPMKVGFFEDMTNDKWTIEDAVKFIDNEKNPFKLLRAWGAMNIWLKIHTDYTDRYTVSYIIRNKKQFNRTYEPVELVSKTKVDFIRTVRDAIMLKLALTLSAYREKTGKDKVLLPKDFSLACPITEKMFVGNMPFGTHIDMCKNNYIGVYWRNEWGTHDFDLHLTDILGNRYGWNAAYTDNKTVVFSGDMTDADPEATEMYYCKDDMPDSIINLHRYNGKVGSKARLFFGAEEISNLHANYMVNPDSIKMRIDIVSEESSQNVGLVLGGKYYAMVFSQGNSIVPSRNIENQKAIINGLKLKLENGYLMLEDILKKAGYRVEKDYRDFGADANFQMIKPDYDFTEVKKDDLIGLFKDAFETEE